MKQITLLVFLCATTIAVSAQNADKKEPPKVELRKFRSPTIVKDTIIPGKAKLKYDKDGKLLPPPPPPPKPQKDKVKFSPPTIVEVRKFTPPTKKKGSASKVVEVEKKD